MTTFAEYFVEALEREGVDAQELIRAWTQEERDQVTNKIRSAIDLSGVIGKQIPDFKGTNQSKGNQAADFLFGAIAGHMGNSGKIATAPGKGYPDMIFSLDGASFCMEFKATSAWKAGDSNRRVLTSSTSKLRSLIQEAHVGNPPAHFICTVLYSDNDAVVTGVRLDFLEPDTPVNIRLEASTSQKLLSEGAHTIVLMP
ncbi:hypothetical protein LOS78_12660 [Paracoccus sp. MA]|uniref:hypothetical protein n=1 Tax=Paracoccus sp. MA TaxID=2895796 RepID=UPI001E2DB242|nr:hypothetical protein [Paracoccus sp. MA]UFM66777.1 hypothetical protein LOS78_12660 [Paracoccus sp. MA]